jgi:hypothetical protein
VVGAEAATDQATHQLVKAKESQKSGSNIVSLKLLLVFQRVAHSHFASFK